MGCDVRFVNFLGDEVDGVIVDIDTSKKKMMAEMRRLRDADGNDGRSDAMSSLAAKNRPLTRAASRSSSCSSDASDTRQPAVSTTRRRVGDPPSSTHVDTPRRQPVAAKRKASPPSARSARAPAAARRIVPPILQHPIATSTAGAVPASMLAPSTLPPLVPPSQLGFSFNPAGSIPLVPPVASDPFQQFVMNSLIALHQEVAGIKAMQHNMYVSWNDLIVQSANRSTGTFQEVNGTRDKLLEVGRGLDKVESAVTRVTEHLVKDNEFVYPPYSSQYFIDSIDTNQNITVLATDIQRNIYDKDDPDLALSYNKRHDKAKAKWLVEAVLHRRMMSTSGNRTVAQRSIIERLNHYAGIRRRAIDKEGRDARNGALKSLRASKGRRQANDEEEDEMGEEGDEEAFDRERGQSSESDIEVD